eukprot:3939683-Rhodomonas_salina.2
MQGIPDLTKDAISREDDDEIAYFVEVVQKNASVMSLGPVKLRFIEVFKHRTRRQCKTLDDIIEANLTDPRYTETAQILEKHSMPYDNLSYELNKQRQSNITLRWGTEETKKFEENILKPLKKLKEHMQRCPELKRAMDNVDAL